MAYPHHQYPSVEPAGSGVKTDVVPGFAVHATGLPCFLRLSSDSPASLGLVLSGCKLSRLSEESKHPRSDQIRRGLGNICSINLKGELHFRLLKQWAFKPVV